ncbi:reducing type I polyketide synthase [Annulohypoxylon truncatum]|uniref:reducing type I polyketide synthase n=1 Tax=Annulohypoxylon truncatum TaxID=327061 RepID=UPI0020079E4F|nr:reducing type I polyketide synthase [Annulohypoxylon truncatum]KAI1205736.1 reducing type I polyketide synthase [Annulohypoxylon truncatum]
MVGDSHSSVNGVNGTHHDGSNGTTTEPKTMPLAIVGMACRFAGSATSPEKLWELVSHGRDAWSEIPTSRFNQKAFYHPDSNRLSTMHVKGGYFLEEDVAAFDLSFFNMTAEAAAAMDPQLRMQLEIAFEAFESAGIPLSKVMGSRTCVFTGAFTRDYDDVASRDPLHTPRSFVTGNYGTMLANRVSHFFDLKGHSTSIDTACSTSLMGLHLACQSLRSGDTDAAVVGGTSLHLSPEPFSELSTVGLCGPDGKCYAFDHRAQGYGRGEGVAALVVKRLSDAVRDGDPIRAVIRETRANQDGKTATITSPDAEAQRRLIEECYAAAGLDPLNTDLVEAHGTGTTVGDPLEAKAISQTLGRHRPPGRRLQIASVKTNLGHTEAASGLASVIKMVMSFEHKAIAPSINFEKPNPDIDLEGLGLQVPTSLQAWSSSGIRRASVNNFGFGGTNTHVILEEADGLLHKPATNGFAVQPKRPRNQLFVLSAHQKATASRMAAELQEYLEQRRDVYADDASFADLAYTLCERRSRFSWTVTATASSPIDLITALEAPPIQNTSIGKKPRLGFVFNGQGAQWFGMGRELASAYPVYARTLKECDVVLRSFGAKWSLLEELSRSDTTTRVNDVEFSMPLSCAVQLALVRLLIDFGFEPTAVTGHSSGEVAAAFAAGALSLREAMACTYFRGLINSEHLAEADDISGGMMAVGLGPHEVKPYLDGVQSGKVVVACVNSQSSVTLSGDIAAIKELEALFKKEGTFARALRVQAAFHSHHMLPLEEEYLAALKQHMNINPDKKRAFDDGVSFVSPVTGKRIYDAERLGPQHWVQNMTQPVLFASSFHNMISDEIEGQQQVDIVIEVGPHSALAGPIRQILKGSPSLKSLAVPYASCLERGKDAVRTIQTLAGFLVERGYSVSTAQVNSPNGEGASHVVTGLPSYPWNHTQRFWSESRMCVEHREREHPPHELLGTRLPGTSNKSPIWRHVIRAEEMPWLREHVVQNTMVYPAAGYIAMAVEAMRQVHASEQTTIAGYQLSEVEIVKAVVIPESSEGVEIQLFLEPTSEKSLDQGKRQFRIYSAGGEGSWDEISRGFISIETSESTQSSPLLPSTGDIDFHDDLPREIKPAELYSTLHKVGIAHGPIFQNLLHIRGGSDCSAAEFQVLDTATLMPYSFQPPHVIHPVTLDQVFQAAYTTLSPEAGETVGTAVPRSIKSLYISAQTSSEPGDHLKAFSQLKHHNHQGFEVISAVLPAGKKGDISHAPVIELDRMRFQSVGYGAESKKSTRQVLADVCAFIDYEPSFSLNDPATMVERLRLPVNAEEKAIGKDLVRATYYLISDAVAQLTENDIQTLEPHHKKLYGWMQQQLEKAASDELAPKSSRWAKASAGAKAMLLDRVAKTGPTGELTVRVGRHLVQILRREIAPLETMLEGGLLYNFYKEMLHFTASTSQLAEVAAMYARENPNARMLEIGAGTGGCTEPVLRALGGDGNGPARFEHYDYTDISSGFFQAARERFALWGQRISYAPLNVEADPIPQGFGQNSYDLIIAAQVLHATKDIHATMRNVRKLLKDGGRLLMVETTKDWPAQHLIFGTLPGWWLSKEPERAMSPNMSLDMWQGVLKNTGFSGLDADVWDCEDEEHQASSVLLTTAARQQDLPVVSNHDVVLVYDAASCTASPPETWIRGLVTDISSLTGETITPVIAKMGEADVTNKVCLFVSGLQGAPYTIDASNFDAIKSLMTSSRGMLWVTYGSTIDCLVPENALPVGLLRTFRTEDASRRLVSLDLDPARAAWDTVSHNILARVFAATFASSSDPLDVEFSERGGVILVPRIGRDGNESSSFAGTTGNPEMQPFMQPEARQLKMEVTIPGQLDTMIFRDDEEAGMSLPGDWLEIQPCAYGLNFHDIMTAMGQLDEAQELGLECAGVVTRAGSSVTDLSAGDRVMALTLHGHFASRVRVPRTNVVPIPDDMPFPEAAGFGLVFATAYYAMFEAAGLEPGETVLVHAAAGGVGQACIMLAQWKGVNVLATVGTPEKRAFLKDTYGISDTDIFSSRDSSFGPAVLASTGRRGVDAVINSLAGPLLRVSWDILASHGRFVEIGKRDIHQNMALEMGIFKKAVSFTAVDLVQLSDQRGRVVQRVLTEVIDLLKAKKVRNISPITTYPMSKLEQAFRTMQAGKHIGKLVVVPEARDMVKTLPVRNTARLNPDATYIVIGGLGGLGRSIARWLVNVDAKNILLLSRHASSSPHAQALQAELAPLGAIVRTRDCDVSDLANLQDVLAECGKTMPPVRGVVHGGMVLDDSILERMTAAQWQVALGPKVTGTRNIDTLFSNPTSLDFFINLSSFVGVTGNPSQGNYGAGGAFQDAIARRRAARGLPCVTIDLGPVKSVGFVAEDKSVADRLLGSGHFRPLEETDLWQLMDYAVRVPVRSVRTAQVIAGIAGSAVRNQNTTAPWTRELRFAKLASDDEELNGSSLAETSDPTKARGSAAANLKQRLAGTQSTEEVAELIEQAVINKVADMFVVPEEDIEATQPLSKYGVDSLVAVELRNWLVPATQCEISIFDLLGAKSLRDLAQNIARISQAAPVS